MRYKITKRGTHFVPLDDINNDLLSPGEMVANVAALIDTLSVDGVPPWISAEQANKTLRYTLAQVLKSAREQGWRFRKCRKKTGTNEHE